MTARHFIFIFIGLFVCAANARKVGQCSLATDQELNDLKKFKFPGDALKGINVDLIRPGGDVMRRFDSRPFFEPGLIQPEVALKLRTSGGKLPAEYSQVGDRCNVAAVFQGTPEENLEPGDIIIETLPTVADRPGNLYSKVSKGKHHAAIVVREPDGKLAHIDAPLGLSGREFKEPFHVLRMRRVPAEITSQKILDEWLADPTKRQKLRSFLTLRKCRIHLATAFAKKMKEVGFKYSLNPDNLASRNPAEFRRRILKGERIEDGVYCSELVKVAYSSVGINGTGHRDIAEISQSVNQQLDKYSKEQNESRQAIAEQALIEVNLQLNGVTGTTAKALRGVAGKYLTEQDKNNLSSLGQTLAMRPEALKKRLESGKDLGPLDMMSPDVVGPSDMFDSVYDPKSDLVYGGTYLPNRDGNAGGQPSDRQISCR